MKAWSAHIFGLGQKIHLKEDLKEPWPGMEPWPSLEPWPGSLAWPGAMA